MKKSKRASGETYKNKIYANRGHGIMKIIFEGEKDEFNDLFRPPSAEWQSETKSLLNDIQSQGNSIMANSLAAKEALQELNTVTDQLADAVGQIAANDQAEDDAFRAKIKELEDKIAANDAITQQDIADFADLATGTKARSATLSGIEQSLRAMGQSSTDPIPTPDVPPVVEPPVQPGTVGQI